MTKKLKELFELYGAVAIGIYFAIFLGVWAGFAIAIINGFEVKSVTSNVGVIGAAWIATKLSQPLRILVTLVLTPIVTKVFFKSRFAKAQARVRPSSKPQ